MPAPRPLRAVLTLALALAPAGTACTRLAARTTADLLVVAAPALDEEPDVELAREASPAQLKTLEGLLRTAPDDRRLLGVVARATCSYAFAFLEDDVEALTIAGRDADAAAATRRATDLYLRCTGYGLRLLGGRWREALDGDFVTFDRAVRAARRGDVPGMYWAAFGLGSAINLNRDCIDLVVYLPKVRMLLERVVALDEGFHDAGAHMALGLLYTAAGAAAGGDPERGRRHFERAIALTGGRLLLPRVFLASSYGSIVRDRAFFRRTLEEVLATAPAIWPERRLANEIARVRARRYLEHEELWF